METHMEGNKTDEKVGQRVGVRDSPSKYGERYDVLSAQVSFSAMTSDTSRKLSIRVV